MYICDDCGHKSEEDLKSQRCGECGSANVHIVETGDNGAEEFETISPQNIDATIDATDVMGTLPGTDIDATLDASDNASTIQGPGIDATLDASDNPATFQSPDIDATLDASDIEATYEFGDSSSVDKTVVTEKTIELGAEDKSKIQESNSNEDNLARDRTTNSIHSAQTIEAPESPIDHTIDGSVDASVAEGSDASIAKSNVIQSSSARVSRGRRSLSRSLDQDSINRWNSAAGNNENPLLSLSAPQSFELDEVPLTNRRRVVVDPADITADYEIVRAVGKGAMGEVFAAKQKSLNRTVALKTISAARGKNLKDQRKFLYEARITSELTHPNIVPVHDLGVGEDGIPFYSMKLVSGTPWQKVIAQKSLDENIDIFMKVCDAIAFAHSQNVIHRDLKPENIMLGSFGEVLVMDWGLAVDLNKEKKFDLAGTPAYMSPEMACHDIDAIGTTSDIYLLGAILYQIVTGKAPHPGRSVTECVLAASSNQLIPPPDPDHPLLKLAMVAIASEPEDRYASVEEFQEAIRDYRRHSESVAQTQRAETVLQRAIEKQDYESFSRAIFGFSSALELWPENKKAADGADCARLLYGKAAIERNDFDLALQVLRPEVEAERPLVEAAQAGKHQAQQRIVRIRRLRNIIAIGAGTAALIFLGLSLWAINEKGKATTLAKEQTRLKGIAEENEKIATVALAGERQARADLDARNVELGEKNEQLEQKSEELAQSLLKEMQSAQQAKEAAEAERIARLDAETAKQEAEVARDDAESARLLAEEEQAKAEQARLVAELRNYPANLSLAATQIQQRDVGRTVDILRSIDDVGKRFAAIKNGPRVSNWALERIRLATNQDLPSYIFGNGEQRITSCDVDGANRLIAAGCENGTVELIHWNGQAFQQLLMLEPNQAGGTTPVKCVALLGQGNWLAFSKQSPTGDVVWFVNMRQPGDNARYQLSSSLLPALSVQKLVSVNGDKQLLALLNGGGIRVWDFSGGVLSNNNPRAPKNLSQYNLLDIIEKQDPAGQNALAIIVTGERQYFATIDWAGDGIIKVQSESPTKATIVAAKSLANNHVVAGQSDGKLAIINAGQNGLQVDRALRDDIHSTSILSIAASRGAERLLTNALEPVIQVWERDDEGTGNDYSPGIQLLGHTAYRILDVDFLGSPRSAVSVDEGGKVVYWDLEKQADRQAIERQELGKCVYSVCYGVGNRLSTVDANGLIRSQILNAGNEKTEQPLFSFVGHTPGAEFQDLDITPDGRFAVTSALLKADAKDYAKLLGNADSREFCVWDFAKGTMVSRWSDQRPGFPCVAISPDGLNVAVGGNGAPMETVVVDLKSGKQTVLTDDNGRGVRADDLAFRKDGSNRLTTTAFGGMVAEFDGSKSYKMVEYNRDFLDPPTNSSQIVAADWKGNYFIVLFNTGHVRLFKPTSSGALNSVANFGVRNIRLRRNQIDFGVIDFEELSGNRSTGGLTITIAAKEPSLTQIVTWKSASSGNWSESNRQTIRKNVRINFDGTTDEVIDLDELAARLRVGTLQHWAVGDEGLYCFTTKAGSVIQCYLPDSNNLARYLPCVALGQSDVVAASSDARGERLVLAGRERQLWRASLQNLDDAHQPASWNSLSHPLANIESVKVSPTGDSVAVLGKNLEGKSVLWCSKLSEQSDSNTTADGPGTMLLESVVATAWRPVGQGSAEELSVIVNDGENFVGRTYAYDPNANHWVSTNHNFVLDLASDDHDQRSLASSTTRSPRSTGRNVLDLTFFGEQFADKQEPIKWYWAILTQTAEGDGSQIHLLSESGEERPSSLIRLPSDNVTSVAGSRVDGLLVTGDSEGAISVWFLAPSVDHQPFEVMAIDRHQGQAITQLAFAADGSALLSGDAGGRQFVWLAAATEGKLED